MEDVVFKHLGKLLALAVFVMLAIAFFGNRFACLSAWENSGMRARWGFATGCQLQRADGSWIPAEAFRDVSP